MNCDKHFWVGYSAGMFGAIFMVILVLKLTPNTYSNAKQAIEECERDLPRTQHCVVSAVPEGEVR